MLVEPQPWAAKRLRMRYAARGERVRVLQAAICPAGVTSTVTMHTINGSNIAMHGTNHSDPRCLNDEMRFEVASLSRRFVAGFQQGFRRTPYQCRQCAKRIGRALPETCMRRVIRDNMVSFTVPCASFKNSSHAAAFGTPPHVLFVDAEGYDDIILQQYFDEGLEAPPLLVYERSHLSQLKRARLAELLRQRGMEQWDETRCAHRNDGSAALPRWLCAALSASLPDGSDGAANDVWVGAGSCTRSTS